MKPDVSSPYDAAKQFTDGETLPQVKLLSPKTKKQPKKRPTKSLNRSHSRRDCKACNDLLKMSIKANPMQNEKQQQEKLKFYTNQYQTHALAGKVTLAEQSIRKIKANHPILSRL